MMRDIEDRLPVSKLQISKIQLPFFNQALYFAQRAETLELTISHNTTTKPTTPIDLTDMWAVASALLRTQFDHQLGFRESTNFFKKRLELAVKKRRSNSLLCRARAFAETNQVAKRT